MQSANQECVYWSYQVQKDAATTFSRVEGSNYVLTASKNKIQLKNLGDRASKQTILTQIKNNDILSLDSCPDTLKVLSSSSDIAFVNDMITGDEITRLSNDNTNRGIILDCIFIGNDVVATCGNDSTLTLFDVRENPVKFKPWSFTCIPNDIFTSIGYSYPCLAVGSVSGTIYMVDVRSQKSISPWISPSSMISVDQHKNLSISFDSTGVIRLYNVRNNILLANMKPVGQKLRTRINCQYVPERNFVLNGSEEGAVYFSLLTDDKTKFYETLKVEIPDRSTNGTVLGMNKVNHVDYDHTSNRLIASSGDGMLHIWDRIFR